MAANPGNPGNPRNPRNPGSPGKGTPRGTRRDNGAGSAYFDASRNRWRGEVTVGRRPDGGRDVRKVSGASRAEVLTKLKAIRRQYEAGSLGTVAQERRTLGEFLERWLGAKAATVRPTSLVKYRERLEAHVVPHLGHLPLKDLTPAHPQTLYARLLAEGLHPRTVRHVHRSLSGALRDAVKWGEAGRNVAQLVTPPAAPAQEVQPPTADEVGRLLAAAEAAGDRLRGLWTLAALTGMRLGELCGLRWEDVDLDQGVAGVRRSLTDVCAGVPTFSAPKTARSRRTVPLSDPAVASLKAHKARQAAERLKLADAWGLGIAAAQGLVFTTEVGSPLRGTNVRCHWAQARARAGLRPTIRFHDLRHFAATSMLAGGTDIPTTSAILGHATAAITLSVYAHHVPSRLQTGVDAIAKALTLPAASATG